MAVAAAVTAAELAAETAAEAAAETVAGKRLFYFLWLHYPLYYRLASII